jgi:non-specific serine/threonine protein kinase
MQEGISFGAWLRKQRRALDLSRRAFANQIGCAEITLRRIEAGTLKPSKELAELLLEKLGILETERPGWISFARGESGSPPIIRSSPNKPLTNLPAPLTSFIGREKEQLEVIMLLSKHRLVTLTGSGGVGKTRLSIQVGEQVLRDYANGVWFLELASLNDSAFLTQAAASLFGITMQTDIPHVDLLISFLRAKSLLLILDNCEHLLDACAHLADTLLKNCPNLKILVTSRESIETTGEAVYRVPSLRLPDLQYELDALGSVESIRLFEERAQLLQFDFSVTQENAPSVAQICHRLDGIPLAIELAAARINVLRVEQIAARLSDTFRLLTGGNRTALPRQQTLQATMDWSYDLLSEKERILLRRLSVFAGGWTLEAAEAVCAYRDKELGSVEILDVLVQLVNKSLILAELSQEETRYRLLEIIRQYALTKLVANGEGDAIRLRHARYCLTLTRKTELSPPRQVEWNDRIEAEHDNMRAALSWSHSVEGNPELELHLAAGLGRFWINRAYWSEARGWLEGALAHANAEGVKNPQLQAQVLLELGSMCSLQSDFEAGQSYFMDSLKIYQELEDTSMRAFVLIQMGWLAREHGDVTTARLRLEEGLAMFRQIGDKSGIEYALMNLGETLVMQEDAEGAMRLLEESLLLSRELNDGNGTGWVLNHLGHVAQIQGQYERAIHFHEESLVYFRESWQGVLCLAWAYQGLGETALAQGNAALAATHLTEALELFHELRDQAGISWCLAGLAGVAALNEEPESAAWLWAAAEALRQSIGGRAAPAARATHQQLQAQVRKQLGQARFDAKWAQGQVASAEEAICEAQRQ